MKLVFDIESDGLLQTITKLHVIATLDIESGEEKSYHGEALEEGLRSLSAADTLIGHNIINYDIPAITKVYPGFSTSAKLVDTLVLSRAVYGDLFAYDMAVFKRKLSPKDYGSHSLRAWGKRLGTKKGEYGETATWKEWSEEMEQYCAQDVRVTKELHDYLRGQHITETMLEMELQFARLMTEQELHGFLFDVESAELLHRRLRSKYDDIYAEMQDTVPPTIKELKTKVKVIPFNPGSTQQIANYFIDHYGWKPTEVTETGKPKVTEDVLVGLPYPESERLAELFKIRKILGMLADGPTAWLKLVESDSRIHGHVNTGGTTTGRCSHSTPNLAQVPSARTELGAECRKLFIAPAGFKIVGCDAAGLESRCLAHFLYQFDGGAFMKELLTGDIHSKNAEAFKCERQDAKTAFYALLYGCGGKKLATILGRDEGEGKEIIEAYYTMWPQVKQLNDLIQNTAKSRGYLYGIDRRHLPFRNMHSAMNVVLQSAGALVMKKAACILDDRLRAMGLQFGREYANVGNIHDELQLEVREDLTKVVGEEAVRSIVAAGEFFKFNCPLDGEYKVGDSWFATH